jgi:uncharacterized protein YqhQ
MDGKDTHGRDTSLYGGQAVIEGVMMKGRRRAVVACRNPKGEIVSKVLLDDSEGKAAKGIRRLPFLRGFFILVDSVSLGIKALNFSAEVAMPEERSGKRDACATIEGEKRKGKAAKADEQSVEGGEGK